MAVDTVSEGSVALETLLLRYVWPAVTKFSTFRLTFTGGSDGRGATLGLDYDWGKQLKLTTTGCRKETVFSGRANVSGDAIYVSVTRIDRYNVSYEVYDDDYSHGILLNRPKNEDLEESLTQSAYRSSNRGVGDLPYDIARDVTRAIVSNKRRKQQEIKLNDGDPVFLAQK